MSTLARQAQLNGQNKSNMTLEKGKDTNFFLSADPTRATMRGASQIRRQHLNRQIFKNLRLRDGAEKMLQAREGLKNVPGNQDKIEETLKTEISFYDKRLEVLYCELANLRSSFEIYQSTSRTSFPIIALSLKDAMDIDWKEPIEEFIEKHYHVHPADKFSEEIKQLRDLRQSVLTPERNENGVKLLYEYYHHLEFIEKRLFKNESLEGVQFVWYDALTAHQKTGKSIHFEKASILFNIGVLWTQIAAKKEFNTDLKSAQEAVTALQKAAGIFSYLKESVQTVFSADLSAEILGILVQIFKVQTHECSLNWDIIESDSQDVDRYNRLARGAVQLSGRYEKLKEVMSTKSCIPPAWCTLAEVKSLYFKAIAHHYAALILLQNYDPDFTDSDDLPESEKRLSTLMELNKVATWLMNEDSRTDKAKSHLKKALLKTKTAVELASKDRFIARLKCTQKIMSSFEGKLKDTLSSIDIMGDLDEMESIEDIQCSTDSKDKIISPEFKKYDVNDIFSELGPLSVFNAQIKFSAPEMVTLNKGEHDGFGISIKGMGPTIVCKVSSWRENGGVQVGDVISEIERNDVKFLNHTQISKLIQACGNSVTLTLLSAESPNTVLKIVQ